MNTLSRVWHPNCYATKLPAGDEAGFITADLYLVLLQQHLEGCQPSNITKALQERTKRLKTSDNGQRQTHRPN